MAGVLVIGLAMEISALYIPGRRVALCPRMCAHGEDASGETAVQIVYSSRRGSRDIEHIGLAHDDAELKALKAAARQRLAAGQCELDLGLAGSGGSRSGGGPLPITSSRMGHLPMPCRTPTTRPDSRRPPTGMWVCEGAGQDRGAAPYQIGDCGSVWRPKSADCQDGREQWCRTR
jgi:hypothetical protein